MDAGRSSGSIPTSCRRRSRSSTITRRCWRRVGSPPTRPATRRCARRVARWPERVWAVEGSNGAGRPLAQRLLEDGEHVVDVPAKLAARVRLFDTGHNRKTDAHDAHAVAVVAVRTKGLRVLAYDGETPRGRASRRERRRNGPGRGTAGRLFNPARSTFPRSSTLRISHFPDPRNRRYNRRDEPGRP